MSETVSATRCEASAPGKLILMGEHAAVYGRPAVVAAVGLRTRARVSPVSTGDLDLDLPDLGHREQCSWEEVQAYGDRRRESWRSYRERPTAESSAVLGSRDEAGVVKVTVAEAMRSLGLSEDSQPCPAIRLSVSSEVPVGSGFGSSASVAVTVGAAFLGSLSSETQFSVGDERVASVALEAEKRQHGRPSGVDHTAVIRGGFLSVTGGGGSLRASDLPRPDWFRRAIRIYDTGAPSETTGEVVAAVRNLRDRKPTRFAEKLDGMERHTRTLMVALGQSDPHWPGLLRAVRGFERCLEDLEVVPAPVAEAVRRVEAAGGAAKISGAGSLSGAGGGSLIVLLPPEVRAGADLEAILGTYRRLDAQLGVHGLELTRASDA